MTATWIEISKSALLNNIFQIKKNLAPQTKFMAVVKANAYGHGLLQVVNAIKSKVDYVAVYDFCDALILRKNKITKPILVLGSLLPEQINQAIKHNIEATITTFKTLEACKKLKGKKLKIHLSVDTGLGRDGFVAEDQSELLRLLSDKELQKKIEVNGLYAHFAAADDSEFDSYTKNQVKILQDWQKSLAKIALKPMLHHGASAAVLAKKVPDFDIARIGVSLYGLWPSDEIEAQRKTINQLQPVLSWKVKISEIKTVKKGSAISYGCTYILKRDSKIAILPIGYFDGIFRSSSNQGWVLLKGKKVKQIGRVTMNLIAVDVTDVKGAKIGDVVTIIGADKKEIITAEDWGSWSKTSNYEIVTRINSALPRVLK